MEIKKVLIRKDGIKMVVVPKDSDIQAGDYVVINKYEEEESNDRKGRK